MGHRARFFVIAALASASGLAASRARADVGEADRQIAQTLFDDGRALMEAGHYAEACPKFAESQRLDPGAGTLLNLALCHEHEGRIATAWIEFRDALSQANRDDRKDRVRVEIATSHIDALAPQVMRLSIVVPDTLAARGPDIFLDGFRLPRTAWDTAIPIDPGAHAIAVAATGSARWETRVLANVLGQTYRVDVPALDTQTQAPEQRRSTAFWIVLAVAGAALATSGITGLLALKEDRYVRSNCDAARDFCRVSDASAAASRATTFAWMSTATLGVGAGAGVAAFLLPRVSPTLTPAPGGATLGLRITGM